MSTQPNIQARPASAAGAKDRATPGSLPLAIAALVAGWLVPGAGHLLLKRWVRGTLLLAAIATLFFVGIGMEGHVYSPNTGDILEILGFLGDLGAGALYLIARMAGWGTAAVQIATADYGKVYIIVAGLLNIVAAVDAHNIALGKKR